MKHKLIVIVVLLFMGSLSKPILSSEEKWYKSEYQPTKQTFFEYLKTKAKAFLYGAVPTAVGTAIPKIIETLSSSEYIRSMGIIWLAGGLFAITLSAMNTSLSQHNLTNEEAIAKIKRIIIGILDDKIAYPTLNIQLEALAYGNEFSYRRSDTDTEAPFNPVNECVRKACNELYQVIDGERTTRHFNDEERIKEEKIDRIRILLKNYLLRQGATTTTQKINELENATINLSSYTDITHELFSDTEVINLLTTKLTGLLEKNLSISSKADQTEIKLAKEQATKNISAMIKNMRIIPFYMQNKFTDIAYADARSVGLAYASELLRLRAKVAVDKQLSHFMGGSKLTQRKKEFNPEIWKPLSQEEQAAIIRRKKMTAKEWEQYRKEKRETEQK